MGYQVHAARPLNAGDLIVRIPLTLALSHSRVASLPIGRAVAALVRRCYRPDRFPQVSRKALARGAMLMAMIAGRSSGAGNWHEYARSLPESFEDALWWPQRLVDALPQVTPLSCESEEGPSACDYDAHAVTTIPLAFAATGARARSREPPSPRGLHVRVLLSRAERRASGVVPARGE